MSINMVIEYYYEEKLTYIWKQLLRLSLDGIYEIIVMW